MSFETVLPRIKSFMIDHYDHVMEWRDGRVSKKVRRRSMDDYEKRKEFILFVKKIEDRKRSNSCSKSVANRILKEICRMFE